MFDDYEDRFPDISARSEWDVNTASKEEKEKFLLFLEERYGKPKTKTEYSNEDELPF